MNRSRSRSSMSIFGWAFAISKEAALGRWSHAEPWLMRKRPAPRSVSGSSNVR
uniref:Uncharacterized protein n=1 Tax=Picea sitchensis TaxID=3332 RepID=A9NYM6_PICSI|nr:unknown [Picea sitchensis]